MLEKYFDTPLGSEHDEHKRLIAVSAALELIKAAISTDAGARNLDYELKQFMSQISPLADAIQDAIESES